MEALERDPRAGTLAEAVFLEELDRELDRAARGGRPGCLARVGIAETQPLRDRLGPHGGERHDREALRPHRVAAPGRPHPRLGRLSAVDAESTVQLLARLWSERRETVVRRVALLERAAEEIAAGGDSLRAEAELEAHRPAGSLGTFGFGEGSRLALEYEQLLQAQAAPSGARAERLRSIAAELRRELARGG